MKAILTKYHGPSTYKGARIVAFDMDNNKITLPYQYGGSEAKNHQDAADTLKTKMGWSGELIGGAINGGYAFVFI